MMFKAALSATLLVSTGAFAPLGARAVASSAIRMAAKVRFAT